MVLWYYFAGWCSFCQALCVECLQPLLSSGLFAKQKLLFGINGEYSAKYRNTMLDACDALFFLHQIGIRHRNLSPECFGVSSLDGRLCIGDFGNSQQVGKKYSKTRPVISQPTRSKSPCLTFPIATTNVEREDIGSDEKGISGTLGFRSQQPGFMHPDSYAMAIIAGLPFFPEFSNEGTERLVQFEQGLSRALSVEGQTNKF